MIDGGRGGERWDLHPRVPSLLPHGSELFAVASFSPGQLHHALTWPFRPRGGCSFPIPLVPGCLTILAVSPHLFFVGHVTCGVLFPQPGAEPAPLAGNTVLTITGLSGKPRVARFILCAVLPIDGLKNTLFNPGHTPLISAGTLTGGRVPALASSGVYYLPQALGHLPWPPKPSFLLSQQLRGCFPHARSCQFLPGLLSTGTGFSGLLFLKVALQARLRLAQRSAQARPVISGPQSPDSAT